MKMNGSVETLSSLYAIPIRPAGPRWTPAEAYQFCRELTVSHYENFPVGSMLIPKTKRPHVYAIYAFARVADDFADEADYADRRLELLEDWDRRLWECAEGKADHPIFIALSDTLKKCDLPIQWFRDLLHAFKMDVTIHRYETFADVLGYCRYSANPVGRLILHLFDHREEELHQLSDHICTALQLTNFWQDITIDQKKDRIYIPLEDLKREGYTEAEYFAQVFDSRLQRILHQQVQRTWDLFQAGYPLLERVSWPLSMELRFTWLGGTTILSRIPQQEYNVFQYRPKLGKQDFLWLGLRSGWKIESYRQHWHRLFHSEKTSGEKCESSREKNYG